MNFFSGLFYSMEIPKRSQCCYFVGWPEGSKVFGFLLGYRLRVYLLFY